MLQDFIVPLPQTAEKKRNGKWTQFVPETSPGNHGRFTTGLFVFYEPPKTDMEILYGTWKCTPNCQRRNIYVQTTTLVSRGVFSPAFFFRRFRRRIKKRSWSNIPFGVPWAWIPAMNVFEIGWINGSFFCHVDSGNLPTEWLRERGGAYIQLGHVRSI